MSLTKTEVGSTMDSEVFRDRIRGCLLGLACGDAVGTTVEFRPRGTFPPVTDMTGGGPFQLPPGAWTDDTSMALCLASSLVECGGFDAEDQMRRYDRWHREGEFSSTGICFDIGVTVCAALQKFRTTGEPFSGSIDPRSAGNGCLMRLAPVALFWHADPAAAAQWAAESARTTHGASECLEACRLLATMLVAALSGASKDGILLDHDPASYQEAKVRALAAGAYRKKEPGQIRGSGYVVESLEAAAWCFWRADSFREAVLLAANLGDDADTTAAVCGQLAGAFHGEKAIPAEWRRRLIRSAEIASWAERLALRPGSGAGTTTACRQR